VTAQRDHRDFLADLVDACRAIIVFAGDMTLDAYLADQKTLFAVMRGFEIMGEAAHPRFGERRKRGHSLGDMAAVRNRVIHGYFGIDDTILFTTIHDELRPLLPRLEALAREHGVAV